MTSKAAAHVLTQLFFILAVPLLLMIGAARLTLSHQFLRFEYSRSGFPADAYGFTTHDRMALGNFAIDYLFNGEDISYLAERRLPLDRCWQPPSAALDCPMFNATELRHMSDVKALANLVFSIATLFCSLICVCIAVRLHIVTVHICVARHTRRISSAAWQRWGCWRRRWSR